MMIARLTVLSLCGVLATILYVTPQGANLRAQKDVSSEVADDAASMRNLIEEFENERRLIEDFEIERRPAGLEDQGFEKKEEAASEAAEDALIVDEIEKERDLAMNSWSDVIPCNSGWGKTPYPFSLNPEIWGTCATMHPCLCGLDSVRFAYMCPNKCRPSCGGKCATTYSTCPNGFTYDMNGKRRSLTALLSKPASRVWAWNLGMPCPIYDHSGNWSP
jgi:hypothetical protein